MSEIAVRWLVSGQVQGVGFRWFTLRRAETLGLGGWVSNLPDGRVEIVARGAPEAVRSLEDAISRGPTFSHVECVEKSAIPHESVDSKSFTVK
ncbi:MAG: acylphosphatase [Armatimonadota bacterium]|jgi:acylphosphatase